MKKISKPINVREGTCCSLRDLEVYDEQQHVVMTTRNTPYPRIMPKPHPNSNPKRILRVDAQNSMSSSMSDSIASPTFSTHSSSSSNSASGSDISSPPSSVQSPLMFKSEGKWEKHVTTERIWRIKESVKQDEKMSEELPDAGDFEAYVEALFDSFPNVV